MRDFWETLKWVADDPTGFDIYVFVLVCGLFGFLIGVILSAIFL